MTKNNEEKQISPEWVRISMAAAIELGLKPGKIAGWVAPPARGINQEDPETFEYIRFN